MWAWASFSAALLLVGATPPVSANTGSSISLTLTGLRNHKGQVLICVTSNAKAFPDCSKDKNAVRMAVKTSNVAGTILRVPLSTSGTYAISAVHDENGNGKMDTAVMMPKEGFGFSRNPAIRFGPPKFKKASFTVGDEASAQTVKMKYML
jgi:uncharacterized protein (DUF2141 family)